MKPLTLFTVIAMSISFTTGSFAADFQTDTFKTKSGKTVTITAIKHSSLRIQFDGLEIQVDPVVKYEPETDYSAFPKDAVSDSFFFSANRPFAIRVPCRRTAAV